MGIGSNLADAAKSVAGAILGPMDVAMIGELTVDVLVDVTGGDSQVITERRLESGYTIADAVIPVPKERSVEIWLTDPEYSADALIGAALSGDPGSLTESWQDKRSQLYAYKDGKEVIALQTHEELIDNMVITDIEPLYDAEENYEGFHCVVTLRQIITAETTEAADGLFDGDLSDIGSL